jgi:hypothetical protein
MRSADHGRDFALSISKYTNEGSADGPPENNPIVDKPPGFFPAFHRNEIISQPPGHKPR